MLREKKEKLRFGRVLLPASSFNVTCAGLSFQRVEARGEPYSLSETETPDLDVLSFFRLYLNH